MDEKKKRLAYQELIELNNSPQLQALIYERCRQDVYYWLFGDTKSNNEFTGTKRLLQYYDLNFVYTLDEDDKLNPIKIFPQRQYFLPLIDLWLKEQTIFLVKSAKMMATWLFVALYLHDTSFNYGRHCFFQSKKEGGANFVLERGKFIYKHQPNFLKISKLRDIFCLLEFEDLSSKIQAVPQGSDQLREYTASGVLSDEQAFQIEAEAAYTAVQPNLGETGKFTGISRPNTGYFYELIKDYFNPQPY
jgi:hypothetical protein